MQIATFIEPAAFMIVAAASIRAAAGVLSFAGQRYRKAREERKYVRRFRALAENRSATAKASPRTVGEDLCWNGTRKFQIARRICETPDWGICSFYLVPNDGQPIPLFRPGQFLTFEIPVPGARQPVVRTYSISSAPTERLFYRVSIKRIGVPADAPAGTPAGAISNYFHHHLQEGDIVDVKAPAGGFCLDQESEQPVVLVAGGVGLTPLVSMLDWLVATKSEREIWFFYGVRNSAEHAMRDRLAALCSERPNVRMVVAYSRPTALCVKGIDYHVEGYVTADLLQPVVKARNCQIYLCGPAPMMTSLAKGLTALGVPSDDIMRETFGPAASPATAVSDDPLAVQEKKIFRVRFSRSGKSIDWSEGSGSLLELAEANGIKARCGCRQGMCGTCTAALAGGTVGYFRQPANEPLPGACLPCIARPESDLVLEM